MTHAAIPHWVEALGLVAGTLGVCIAVWLQLVVARDVRPRYVMGFLALGTMLMLANLQPAVESGTWAAIGRAAAYVGLIVLEAALAVRVYRESDIGPSAADLGWA